MSKRFLILSIIFVIAIAAAATAYYSYRPNIARLDKFRQWRRDPTAHADWSLVAGTRCGTAPFLFPTDGFAGFLWGDSFGLRHTHQGIDVFAGTDVGITRVIAAYPGYLTRSPDWKSAVIMRVPEDPLQPGRQIGFITHIWQMNRGIHSSPLSSPRVRLKSLLRQAHFLVIRATIQGIPITPLASTCIFPSLKMIAMVNSRMNSTSKTLSTLRLIWGCPSMDMKTVTACHSAK